MRQVCPLHSDEEIEGSKQSDGSLLFECRRRGHLVDPFVWLHTPLPEGIQGDGVMADFDLFDRLPAALTAVSKDCWVEYGLIEREYARRHPMDFDELVRKYGHTAIASKNYTVASLFVQALSLAAKRGKVLCRWHVATGHWAYNEKILWFATGPQVPQDSATMSCVDDEGYDVCEYVPGAVTPGSSG